MIPDSGVPEPNRQSTNSGEEMMGASDPRDDDTVRENPSDGEQRREAASGQTSTAATAVAEEETKPRRTCWRKRFHVVPPKRRWQRRHTHDRHMDTEQVKDEPPPVVSVSLNVHNHNTQGPTETMDFMQKLGAGIALGYLVYRMLTAVGWLKLGPIEDEDSLAWPHLSRVWNLKRRTQSPGILRAGVISWRWRIR
jgi:hypothetical protein